MLRLKKGLKVFSLHKLFKNLLGGELYVLAELLKVSNIWSQEASHSGKSLIKFQIVYCFFNIGLTAVKIT
jgi:hypothetical protein